MVAQKEITITVIMWVGDVELLFMRRKKQCTLVDILSTPFDDSLYQSRPLLSMVIEFISLS